MGYYFVEERCGGGGVLLLLASTGRLHSKGVPFLGFRYMKGREICHFRVQGPKRPSNKIMLFMTLKKSKELFGFS